MLDNFGSKLKRGDFVAVVWDGGKLFPVVVSDISRKSVRVRYPAKPYKWVLDEATRLRVLTQSSEWVSKTKVVPDGRGIIKITVEQVKSFNGYCTDGYLDELVKMREKYVEGA